MFTVAHRRLLQAVMLTGCGALSTAVWAQASSPNTEGGPNSSITMRSDAPTAPGVAARNSAAKTVDQTQGTAAARAVRQGDPLSIRGGLVTQVGSGQPVAEGSRVLRLPGKCTPKTGSLDCVAEGGQAPTGANVSSKVRNSVIGEVGAGRAATEGSGTVKRKEACTPAPGKLTCD
ncbi:hypothetical protein [Aquabacterium sp.]|uniref:hypothetical protein n=1 Tax=Aquabacterium sp. TaxID=1872578 RepID=UPI003D6CEF4E